MNHSHPDRSSHDPTALREAAEFYQVIDENRWRRDTLPEMEGSILEWLPPSLAGQERTLVEFGSGRGAFRSFSRFGRYIAIDLSHEALRRFTGPPGALQASIEAVPLKDQSADFVFSIATLEHVPDPQGVLEEIDRILKPAGTAFLAPAWFCRPWAAAGLHLRSFRELGFANKLRKTLVPLRNSALWRGAFVAPRRLFRELQYHYAASAWRLWYRPLRPNLERYVCTDSDAFSSLDPHEVALFFLRRRYEILSAPGFFRRLALRHAPLVVRKREVRAPLVGAQCGRKDHPCRLAVVISHPVQYFSPLFRRLAERPEIDLTVLYSSLAGALPALDQGFGIKLAWDTPLLEGYKFKTLKNLCPGSSGRFWSYTSPGIVAELWRGRYDAVLVYGWGDLSAWFAILAARWAHTPCMITGDSNGLYERELPPFKARLKRAVLAGLFREVRAFAVTGPSNRLFYQYYGTAPEKMFCAPLAVDNDYFTERAELARPRKDEIRARYGIRSDIVLLLFVGKLVSWKRPLDLLLALQKLQSSFPRLGAAWVGEGELRRQLEVEISMQGVQHAYVLGFKNQTELPDLYAAADILVFPSWFEPMGLVANEAMACGLPVIASDRTGVWGPGGLVRDGETGFVYRAGDIAALSEAVRKLVADAELRQAMGRRAVEVVKEFGLDRCVAGILEALRFAVART